jgi:hypothetical protein
MIISHTLRFVYIGPPKTAPTTMHAFLSQLLLFDGERDVNTIDSQEQHKADVPPECEDYFTFATVREPAARLDSLWRHCRGEAERLGIYPVLSFEEFLEWRKTCFKPFLAGDQEYYLKQARIDQVVRVERLREDVERLPFAMPLLDEIEPPKRLNRNRWGGE